MILGTPWWVWAAVIVLLLYAVWPAFTDWPRQRKKK